MFIQHQHWIKSVSRFPVPKGPGLQPSEDPVLPFLAFLENGKENHEKNKDFLSPPNP